MNYTQLFADDLRDRATALEEKAYFGPEEWEELAQAFEAVGRVSGAAALRSKAAHYADLCQFANERVAA